jgi:precorrin-2/cobalt-factor-2 C20-methyltransferase
MSATGTLHGVGVGPGDPALLTLRAAEVLARAPVVAWFAKRGRPGHARTIVEGRIGQFAMEIPLIYPVTTEIPVADPAYATALAVFYEESADLLAAHLAAGRSVALLSEGDPFFYGSFMHVWRRLKSRFPVEVIPGVTGMAACWTAAEAPITWGDDVLVVLPATLSEDELVRRLALADAAVIMKLGRNMAKARSALLRAGLGERAVYVERGSMAGERVLPLADAPDDAPYFAMVVVPGEGRRP